jgi:hypothetical protein
MVDQITCCYGASIAMLSAKMDTFPAQKCKCRLNERGNVDLPKPSKMCQNELVTDQNYIHEDIKSRFNQERVCYRSAVNIHLPLLII